MSLFFGHAKKSDTLSSESKFIVYYKTKYVTHTQIINMFDMLKNKVFIGIFFSVLLSATGGFIFMQSVSAEPEMMVYKSPTCGCCGKWITHMEENGFKVNAIDVLDMNIVKEKYGIDRKLASCHTAIIDGYVVEGHVPALDIKQLLSEKPEVIGLSVPGMPAGSPGMEMGGRVDHYSVIAIDKEGNTQVFNQY